MADRQTACIILAAGLGTRMKSSLAKVLHPIYDRPMLDYCIETAVALKPAKTVVVVNKQFDTDAYSLGKDLDFAIQKEQKGTANAVASGLESLKDFIDKGTILVLNGDTPLVTPGSLKKFLKMHQKNKNSVSVLSFMAYDPTGYGRIIRDENNNALGIVEEKDATAEEKEICEVNSGVYALEASALPLIKTIRMNKKKGEYYLTDIVSLAQRKNSLSTGVYCVGNEDEFLGINSRTDLALAHEALRLQKVRDMLVKGVTLIDPASVYVAPKVKVGSDTIIYPNVYLHGKTIIGKGCTLFPNSRIVDSNVKDGAIIKDACLVEESVVGPGSEVGPMAHLRPGTVLGKGVKVGNFVEIKKSLIGDGTKAMHLSYIGDATVGKGVNIGAGTITCNYDGKHKHKTEIGNGVFVGSDSQLVAPVKIGNDSYVGAGSTITKDVPAGALSLSRSKQKTLRDWARKRKK